jgi:TRAP-type C4-dicarboxylate transport system permease small subunit
MKKKLDWVVDSFLGILVLGMTVVVFISVFYRYVLNHPLSWSEEITRLMIVWLSFVGAYAAMRENKHIGFDLLVAKFPEWLRRLTALFGQVLIAVFLIVVVWEGFIFSREFTAVTMPYTDIPIGLFYYSVFPVSGILMLAQTVLNIIEAVKARKKA